MLGLSPNPPAAYQRLAGDMRGFLRRFPIRVLGSETASQQLIAVLLERRNTARRPLPGIGTRWMVPTRAFEVRTPRLLRFAAGPLDAGHAFAAHYIHVNTGELPPPLYRLPLTQPVMMITPLLTGCSFVIVPHPNGELDVAHVRPTAPLVGSELPAYLAHGLPDGAIVYGATPGNYTSGTRVVTIIGMLDTRRGRWRIYAQKQEDLGAQGEFRVLGAQRIYPEHD
jgi:hypothetical protein